MKLYECDICGKISKKAITMRGYDGEEKYYCSYQCMAAGIDKKVEQLEQDRELFEFLRDDIGLTD